MPRLSATESHEIRFTLNGRAVSVRATPRILLSDVLRHDLGATGTHVGCEHGVCGVCTIRIDGAPARSCLTLAVQAEGRDIRTVEGLGSGDALSPLQAACRANFALQCGFCTPGILMSLDALFDRDPEADEAAIRDAVSGHLCRCTGYDNIIRAAMAARDELLGGKIDA